MCTHMDDPGLRLRRAISSPYERGNRGIDGNDLLAEIGFKPLLELAGTIR